MVSFLAKWAIFNTKCRSMRIKVFNLMLIEELLNGNFGPIKFGLIDKELIID